MYSYVIKKTAVKTRGFGCRGGVQDLAINALETQVVVHSRDGRLTVADLETGCVLHRIEQENVRGLRKLTSLQHVALSYYGGTVLTEGAERGSSENNLAILWDRSTGQVHWEIPLQPRAIINPTRPARMIPNPPRAQPRSILHACISMDESRVAICSWDHKISVYCAQTGDLVSEIPRDLLNQWEYLSFGPDAKTLTSTSPRGGFHVWDTDTGAVVWRERRCDFLVQNLIYSPYSRWAAGLDSEDPNKMRVYYVRGDTFDEFAPVYHKNVVRAAAFSPSACILVTGGDDKRINIWNTHLNQLLLTIRGDIGRVTKLAFSVSGKHLVAGDDAGTVSMWDFSDLDLSERGANR